MDNNRELRAMLLSCLHLPPLPAVMSRVGRDDGTFIDEAAESSHGLVGNLIEWAGCRGDQAANRTRMDLQLAALDRFKTELRALDPAAPDEALYAFYCEHTRHWLACYTDAGARTRFMPLDYVATNDPIHRNMQDYCKAQHFHFTNGATLDLAGSTPYPAMLRKCAEWMRD